MTASPFVNPTRTRRANNRELLLRALADGAWHPSVDLARSAGLRFSSRLHELRTMFSVHIEMRRVGADVYEYRWHDAHRLEELIVRMSAPPRRVQEGHAQPAAREPEQLQLFTGGRA